MLGAVAYPFAWPPTRDSFPLSNYPMFSRELSAASFSLQYAVGVTADGAREHLAPHLVANGEVLQARAVLGNAVSRGRSATMALCRSIAERVAEADDLSAIDEVRIVTGRHDAVDYLTGKDRVGKERVHGRCPVPRAREEAP